MQTPLPASRIVARLAPELRTRAQALLTAGAIRPKETRGSVALFDLAFVERATRNELAASRRHAWPRAHETRPLLADFETRRAPGLPEAPPLALVARAASSHSGSPGTLEGIAAPFDRDSLPFEGASGRRWVERVAPGAFTRTLRESQRILALWSHDPAQPLAVWPRSLTLIEDLVGLRSIIQLAPTSFGITAYQLVRARIVDAMSFGFKPRKVRWIAGDDYDIRVLEDVDLIEVSPVIFPAYPGASLHARSHRCITRGDAETRAIALEREAFFGGLTSPLSTAEQRAVQRL